MKKFLMLVALLMIPAVSSAAPYRQGPYFAGFLGVTVPEDADASGAFHDRIQFDPGLNIGGAAGFDFGAARLEGEISYKQGEVKTVTDKDTNTSFRGVDGSIDVTAFMANIFVDLQGQMPITPYFGGGVGFAAMHQSDTFDFNGGLLYAADDAIAFAYQVGAGLEIPLNRQLSLDLAYRYFATSTASFVDDDVIFRSHNATVGLRFKY